MCATLQASKWYRLSVLGLCSLSKLWMTPAGGPVGQHRRTGSHATAARGGCSGQRAHAPAAGERSALHTSSGYASRLPLSKPRPGVVSKGKVH